MQELRQVAQLLGITLNSSDDLIVFRTGSRTRAVVATKPDVGHRLAAVVQHVVVKLYKGTGVSPGSIQYQTYHQSWFHKIDALTGNSHVQRSLEGGVLSGVGPYAALEFVEGEELAERLRSEDLTRELAGQIMEDILGNIWVPLWHAGLRFKDCHPGNFVLTPSNRVVMIDTEQMRKDVDELLHRPAEWSQRDKHELQGLTRLPRLIQRVICAAGPAISDAAILRVVKTALDAAELSTFLSALGRQPDAFGQARNALEKLLANLRTEGLIA